MNYSRMVYPIRFLLILPVCVLISKAKFHHHKVHRNGLQTVWVHHSEETNVAKVVSLARAFKATLSKEQLALLQRDYSKNDAVRQTNFPTAFSLPDRVGLNLGSLNSIQLAAFKALMSAALADNNMSEGYNEIEGTRVANAYLGKATGQAGTFGTGNYYIAFLGQPSETGLWELRYGGHGFAFSNTYDKGKITGPISSLRSSNR